MEQPLHCAPACSDALVVFLTGRTDPVWYSLFNACLMFAQNPLVCTHTTGAIKRSLKPLARDADLDAIVMMLTASLQMATRKQNSLRDTMASAERAAEVAKYARHVANKTQGSTGARNNDFILKESSTALYPGISEPQH